MTLGRNINIVASHEVACHHVARAEALNADEATRLGLALPLGGLTPALGALLLLTPLGGLTGP